MPAAAAGTSPAQMTAREFGSTAPARPRGRFAPTPSGPLHFGSLVAATGSWLAARAAGAEWRLRIDDLDPFRCVPGVDETILRTLEGFGLTWDGTVLYQSRRREVYEAALIRLSEAGSVFPCACTRKGLRAAALDHGPAGPIYPGTCRNGLPAGRAARSLRVRTAGVTIRFVDELAGLQETALDIAIGDFLVRRGDGIPAYHLATVIDDAYQEITHVVRGADLLPITPAQVHLQQLLALPRPAYAHLPIARDAQGRKLAKQTGADPVPEGGDPRLLADALGVLGHPPPAELRGASCDALLEWALQSWCWQRVPADHPGGHAGE